MSGKDNNKNNNNRMLAKEEGLPLSRRHGKRVEESSMLLRCQKQPGEVPILRLNQPNSFYAFKEAISKAAVEQYGHDVTLFETGVLYKPVRPSRSDYQGEKKATMKVMTKYCILKISKDMPGRCIKPS